MVGVEMLGNSFFGFVEMVVAEGCKSGVGKVLDFEVGCDAAGDGPGCVSWFPSAGNA